MNLSKSLRLAIANKGIKHKELADALNTSSQQVSNWIKSGTIRQSSIMLIASYFDLSVSDFIRLGEDE